MAIDVPDNLRVPSESLGKLRALCALRYSMLSDADRKALSPRDHAVGILKACLVDGINRALDEAGEAAVRT